ncbi:RNA polymerase sigma factor [Steroidobacter sp.]|uniref:RNA polymerase sigma factor n=1 Tax=Steroidobacter sp. TaxID=1978227 RepID=UPI001A4E8A4E|nr:sigma-70 family RNA polymerase sigma factor [Steroidobacter sp.]MBL8266500.1 sigma-70 family RNA polymerase sigma factor [Steroidobacter sp.]
MSLPHEASHSDLLQALSQRYRAPLRGFFEKRLRAKADVEDLVQEVFVRLAQRRDLTSIEQIEGYLFQVAANLLRDRGRREAVRGVGSGTPAEATEESIEVITPERVLQGTEVLDRVIDALHQLPERTRTVFVLQRFEDLSYLQIARRLGLSVSSVEKHMMKAMAHIKRRVT